MDSRLFLSVLVLVLYVDLSFCKNSAPKVQIYTRDPGHYDKPNILICHVSGFYPPELDLKLLRNNEEIKGANQTDLAFEEDWYYHLTKHAHFHPKKGDKFTCAVTHLGKTTRHHWEPDM
ncbi:beta-2-microglobulin, like [Boleophthalmus pectinirostris]|uniref:beta-2-microglobulin, like n=1 Tax=Boleophthalmus pectinirostris TaxID=150288 RepID=UPI00242D3F52|nr:beta-2-microglobulin, like [Boleophthalmus pectinirostris]